MPSKSIFNNQSAADGKGAYVPASGNALGIPESFLRTSAAPLPNLSELQVVRHFTNLSRKNFSVDTHFYPLGSCTMKYNPRISEKAAALPGFSSIHPEQSIGDMQGSLEVMYRLGEMLKELTGMDAFTPQPAAGAHGEYTGMGMIHAHFKKAGENRDVVLVPDSAHGTNPASAAMHSFRVKTVKSDARGLVDLEDLKSKLDSSVAALMLTNPNTLGLFETDIKEIAALVHSVGGMLYYDGANLNAIAGHVRPGDMGFDVVHLNLHKTFATPHGGGGPGSGTVLCSDRLAPFLPAPLIAADGKKETGIYRLDWREDQPSIGMVRSFFGPFPVMLRAFTYLLCLGAEGVRHSSSKAVLNANYLKKRLSEKYDLPVDGPCMHEFVLSAKLYRKQGVRALDIAKALIDYGIHPPTVYFPLIIPEAIMIEPTETESLEVLDRFIEVMLELRALIDSSPESFADFPKTTRVSRLDEVKAVKEPCLRE